MDNIISEPVRRDTAPAIALGIGLIKAADPHGVMLVIPSDHLIQDQDSFRTLMKAAMDTAAREKALVTIGIKPTWPCPSYGYIERGEEIHSAPGCSCREVIQFREKPDTATAAAYLSRGNFCWNAGMFVWSIPAVCEQLDKHCPELASFVEHVAESPAPQETIREEFPTLTPVSIDFALMEHADRVLNMEATFDWDDVGSWISVANYLETHNKNTTNTDITVQDASGNIVFSQKGDKHVALLGVENLIVVETADAILIADKNKADEIKGKSSTSCQTNSDDQSAPRPGHRLRRSPHRHCRHGPRGHHGPSRRNYPQASDGRNFPHCPARPETGNPHPGAGPSVRMDGTEGTAAAKVRAFGRELAAALPGLPLIFMDECLTTVIAQEKLHAAGKKAKNFRPIIDQVAAVEILNTWLDSTLG